MNLMPNFSPDLNNTGGKIEKEMKPLEAYPIFRENDLYCQMFPEIKPLFKKGEEPSVKILYDFLVQQKDKKVIMDKTCFFTAFKNLEKVKLSDLPTELGFSEVPNRGGKKLDVWRIYDAFREKMQVNISEQLIDSTIADATESNFSKDVAKALLEIAKKKNSNIKQVFIISDNIADHVGKALNDSTVNETILILNQVVNDDFNIDAQIIKSIDIADIKDTDLIIVDRHNPLVSTGKNKNKLRQISVLPLETEMHQNEEFLGEQISPVGIANQLRKLFEVTT